MKPRPLVGAVVGACLACAMVAALVAAPDQTAQAPVRDAAATQPPPHGTSAVSGVVLSAEAAPQPLGRAIVTIAGPALPSARSAITDETGRFVVADLPAGAYTVTGRKAAFIDGAYGATRPGRPGTPIVIAAGQRADVRLFLARGGVVTGTIRDEAGRARANVLVGLINIRDTRVDQVFSTGVRAQTDDRGVYRLFGLAPGDYLVVAFQGFRGTGEVGRHRAAEIDALLAELSRRAQSTTATSATLVGQPVISPSLARPHPPLASAETAALAPAFYPGVSVYRQAEPVRIAAGEVRAGVDFAFAPIRTTMVEGQVQNVTGTPIAGIDLTIESDGPSPPAYTGAEPTLTRPPGPDGAFAFTNVSPGLHRIVARARTTIAPPQPAGRGGGTFIRDGDPNAPIGAYLYAVADIEVTGAPIRGLSLTLRPGVTAQGRVVFDGASAAAPVDVTKVRLLLDPVRKAPTAETARGRTVTLDAMPSPTVAADGTFALRNIAPGAYGARALLPPDAPSDWWLRSVSSGGRDLLDAPLSVATQDLDDIVVTFSNRHSELAGTLQAAGGQPAPDYYVVVFTTDRALWRAGARRVRVTRPDTRGGFSVRDLPGGEYFIAALTDVAEGEWNEIGFLETLAGASVRVTVKDGSRTVQDLRIAR